VAGGISPLAAQNHHKDSMSKQAKHQRRIGPNAKKGRASRAAHFTRDNHPEKAPKRETASVDRGQRIVADSLAANRCPKQLDGVCTRNREQRRSQVLEQGISEVF